ncbi:hypothetical protein LOTGIDRAFT_234473 [Lottia gigantea]|uniref:EGF-like domain-containing protein n=1 Tax=Lottia gigantea TaxID=225164 RepID=V3ZC28_LOTGI|nr:hypothetical protein LOTGIDRAFT_234473 [Lottia gigantea]ESO88603.1 hypothetical protein LOTGIDRAFT_234473 [Lottia gigantea]
MAIEKRRGKQREKREKENNLDEVKLLFLISAICRGRSDSTACSKYFPYSHIVLADKTTVNRSVGKCIRPDVCECKQVGFYSAGSFCDICSPINNCDLEYCTTKTDQKCRKCEGLVQDRPGYRAYILSADKRSCEKACSWRPDSRCYPGTCRDELFSNCGCKDGFTGSYCQRITAIPDILYNQVTLTADNGETVDAPGDFGSGSPQPLTWTNIMKPKDLYYSFRSNYYKPSPTRPPFVVDYKVGIIDGRIRFTKYGRNGVQTQTTSCSTISKDNPNQGIFDCTKTIQPTFSVPFQHLERLSFKITTSIGGFVKIKDLERNVYNTYYYTPNSLSREYEIKFDNVPPYHCQTVNNCNKTMLTDIDILKKAENTVYWDHWVDDDSGIAIYELEIFSLKSVGNELMIDKRTFNTKTTLKNQRFNVPLPGVYSVILAVVDKAGNVRLTRRCLIFEDKNHVSTVQNTNLTPTSALPSTNYTWQQKHGPVTIDWENRYVNTKHHNGKYLAGIQDYHGLVSEYDDHYGTRTTKPIDNFQVSANFCKAHI